MLDEHEGTTPGAEQPSARSRLVAFAILGTLGALLLVVGVVAAARTIGGSSARDVEPGQAVEVTIEPGSSAASIYATLESAGVARSTALRETAKNLGVEERLRAGTYVLTTGSDPEDVIRQLLDGSNTEAGNSVTIIEGWTVDRMIDALSEATSFSKAEFQRVLRNGEITSAYLPDATEGVDELSRWEGLFYPAKYPIDASTTPVSLLGDMADEMSRRLDAADWSRLEALGVSRYEALVIGSLIEREAGTDEERDTIASVIYNRLDQGMRLQIDATVIYALGFNPGRVLAEHLEVESPYNTYRVDGLPPTPIGTVSAASLRAAGDPATTPYLFYVLGSPDGSHLFAETYEGHQQNIEDARASGVLP